MLVPSRTSRSFENFDAAVPELGFFFSEFKKNHHHLGMLPRGK